MDSATAVLLLINQLATGFASSYLAGRFDDAAKGKFGAAVERLATRFRASIESALGRAPDPETTEAVLGEVAAAAESGALSPAEFADGARPTADVVRDLEVGRGVGAGLGTDEAKALLREVLTEVVAETVRLRPAIEEWEKRNWDRNFDLLGAIGEDTRATREDVRVIRETMEGPTKLDDAKAQRFERLYRAWLAEDTSRIRLLGIRTPEVVDFDLETAWVDLGVAALRQTAPAGELPEELEEIASLETVRRRLRRARHEAGEPAGSVDAMLAVQRRLVIVGAPGSGKTTLMRYLAHLAAKGELRKVGRRLREDRLPFLFLVRSLNVKALPRPEEFIARLAPNLEGQYPEGFVTQQLANGRAFILVDGLDECEKANHGKVMAWIRDLTNTFGDCRFLVTSRPAGYQAGELRGCRYGEAELEPVGDVQREAFVRRWYRAAEQAAGGATADQDAKRGAEDLLGRIHRTASVRTLATNPLLLSVLCVVHRYRHESLPERRAQLLDECVDVLLHEWRQAQLGDRPELVGELDASGKAALVRPLAWWMMEQGIAEARREDVRHIFQGVLPAIGEDPARAPELLAHLCECSGLLVEHRAGIFAFAHLVFQEYLAAEHAEDEGEWDALLRHAAHTQWQEVIPMAAGLSAKAARTLVEALKGQKRLALAGRCVATSLRLSPALRREVTEMLAERAGRDPQARTALAEIGGEHVVRTCTGMLGQSALEWRRLARACAIALPAAYEAAFCAPNAARGEGWEDALRRRLAAPHPSRGFAKRIARRSRASAAWATARGALYEVGGSVARVGALSATLSVFASATEYAVPSAIRSASWRRPSRCAAVPGRRTARRAVRMTVGTAIACAAEARECEAAERGAALSQVLQPVPKVRDSPEGIECGRLGESGETWAGGTR
ncbi:MAG: NACHT domain-containing protein [Armatimonadetes bacterium]|nr:NACHT domain-containing protein [Armatimonadota bacterium]